MLALVLSELTKTVSGQVSLEFNVWYCKDGVLVGLFIGVKKVLNKTEALAGQKGVCVKLSQCNYFILFDIEVPIFVDSMFSLPVTGFNLLGSLIGESQYLQFLILSYVNSLTPLFEELIELQHSQFFILSICLSSCKVNQQLKTTILFPPDRCSYLLTEEYVAARMDHGKSVRWFSMAKCLSFSTTCSIGPRASSCLPCPQSRSNSIHRVRT